MHGEFSINWKVKNMLFHVFGFVPFGQKVYYWCQKHITKSVWLKEKDFIERFDSKVKKHLENIEQYGRKHLSDASVFEFGAGWDLLSSVGFAVGGSKYWAVDLNKYAHPELVKNTLNLYKENVRNIEECYSDRECFNKQARKLAKISKAPLKQTKGLLDKELGIVYCAPMDAGNTPFPTGSMNYVVSNVTLEHIPYEEINRIFKECYRLLDADGIMSVTIDYMDHWAYSDHSISAFNFYKYSDKEWKRYNPRMHYVNRLRHSDYVDLFEKNGFKIILSKPYYQEKDRKILERIKLADKFKKYSFEELLYRGATFIAVKKAP